MLLFLMSRKEKMMDNSTIKNLERDHFEARFVSSEEFLKFLKHLETTDEHVELPISALSCSAVDANTSQTAADAAEKTCLLLNVNGADYPVLTMAYPSIKRRSELDTRLMNIGRLSTEVAAGMFNIGFGAQKKKATVFLRGDSQKSVIAVHSNRYVTFSQREVFDYLSDYLAGNFDAVGFVEATYNHDLTSVQFKIEDENLITSYRALLHKAGIKADDMFITARLYMSDTGYSSITVAMDLNIGKRTPFPFTEVLQVKHRDSMTFDDVKDEIGKTFSLVRDAFDNLEKMMKINLKHPVKVAEKVTAKYNLPKNLVDDLIPQYQTYEDFGQEITAHDFYRVMASMTSLSLFRAYSEKRQIAIQNSLSKLAFMTEREWTKADTI